MVSVFSVGARPLLQGVPSFKQSTGLFEIHPLPSARSVRVFRRLRTAARALPLTRQPFLREKAGPKNLSCLWQALIGRSDPQILIMLVNNKKAESDKALCLGYSNLLHRLHDQILRCLGRKRSAPDKALDKIAADTAQRFELFGLLNAL